MQQNVFERREHRAHIIFVAQFIGDEMEEEARHDGELIRSGVCRLYKGESLVRSMLRFAGGTQPGRRVARLAESLRPKISQSAAQGRLGLCRSAASLPRPRRHLRAKGFLPAPWMRKGTAECRSASSRTARKHRERPRYHAMRCRRGSKR